MRKRIERVETPKFTGRRAIKVGLLHILDGVVTIATLSRYTAGGWLLGYMFDELEREAAAARLQESRDE